MRRIWMLVVLAGVVAGCAGPTVTEPVVEKWPDVECPMGGGVTARIRLQQIEGWAPPGSDARTKASICRESHVGLSEIHCMHVYSAWAAAGATQQPGLEPEQIQILWAYCISELTHDPSGGKSSSGGTPLVWPAVECPQLSGVTAGERLQEIAGWAQSAGKMDAQLKAQACMTHTGMTPLHCARVFSAWSAAKATLTPGLPQPQVDALWLLCISELTHDPSGGSTGG